MKIFDLIAQLNELPPDADVYLFGDEEGVEAIHDGLEISELERDPQTGEPRIAIYPVGEPIQLEYPDSYETTTDNNI